MAWNDYDQRWSDVMGDDGPWVRHVPAAWLACARHDGAPVDIPERVWWQPSADLEQDNHADFLAYWTTPIQLLVYGLGWPRPDLGLHQWASQGLPEEEPVLRVVKRWWGEDGIYWFLEWAHGRGGIELLIRTGVNIFWPLLPQSRPAPHPSEVLRRPQGPENPFGLRDGDVMHLTGHLGGPMTVPEERETQVVADLSATSNPNHVSRRVLVSDTYAGWYAQLMSQWPARTSNGRSVLTDVVVKPIGWLGEFRRHDATGLWFRGRSAVHLWGN